MLGKEDHLRPSVVIIYQMEVIRPVVVSLELISTYHLQILRKLTMPYIFHFQSLMFTTCHSNYIVKSMGNFFFIDVFVMRVKSMKRF